MITVATIALNEGAAASTVFKSLAAWSVAALLILSVSGYLGRIHKYLELTSHFRVQYLIAAAVCLPFCLAYTDWWCASGALSGMIVNLSAILPWYRTRNSVPDGAARQRLKVALVNVDHLNRAHERFVSCMAGHQPDVIVVQELSEDWARGLQDFGRGYPFSEVLPMGDGSGIALYSRWPFERLPLVLPEGDDRPGILASVQTETITVVLLAIHPRAPIRRGHFELRNNQLATAALCIRNLPGPKVCIGDMNTSLWSPFYEDFAKQADLINARKGFGLLPSWPTFLGFRWLMIPIDHCLVSRDIRVVKAQTGERIGSDHLPLIVELEIGEKAADYKE